MNIFPENKQKTRVDIYPPGALWAQPFQKAMDDKTRLGEGDVFVALGWHKAAIPHLFFRAAGGWWMISTC